MKYSLEQLATARGGNISPFDSSLNNSLRVCASCRFKGRI